MRIIVLLVFCMLCGLNLSAQTHKKSPKGPAVKDEIIYHIFQRSFYDSNGDGQGDLNGIRQKLDYIQQLGATAILLTPLYASPYYHNYFADDFYKIDPKYGTMKDYLALIKELHRRGMKFYMDMETQYVTENHTWWKDGVGNPKSKYADYILYEDSAHTKPASIVYGLYGFKGYDDVYTKITTVNLNSPKVLDYNYHFFKFWMDPNSDGKFNDGVDGFRLDHMADNLDQKPALQNLFGNFWTPLLGKLRKVNPKISIVAEQDWASMGVDYLKRGGVDRVFDFRMAFAIRSFKKTELAKAADSTYILTPKNKQQVIFIENHDVPRFSYGVKGELPKLKVGAALNLLIGGIPSIYYGQELGMTGNSAKFGPTDANEIPDRQAFEWYKSDEGKGMAYWYKLNGPYKDQFNDDKPNDGISLEEEKGDPNSLWNFYHGLIALRKANPVIIHGAYKNLLNSSDEVYSFERYLGKQKVVVAVNLSNKEQVVAIQLTGKETKIKTLHGVTKISIVVQPDVPNAITVIMPPYGIGVWEVK
ncbi:MAG: alpha-amylase family glycosyl hydrolase [Sphingobacteriales bacterium]